MVSESTGSISPGEASARAVVRHGEAGEAGVVATGERWTISSASCCTCSSMEGNETTPGAPRDVHAVRMALVPRSAAIHDFHDSGSANRLQSGPPGRGRQDAIARHALMLDVVR